MPDCYDSTAFPEGAPDIHERLDAAIADARIALASWNASIMGGALAEIATVASEHLRYVRENYA